MSQMADRGAASDTAGQSGVSLQGHQVGRPGQRVLLAGATGFVGRQLWPALEAAGYEVRGLTRDAAAATRRWPRRDWVEIDVESPPAAARLPVALSGCAAAYYLVHGMGAGDASYVEREAAAAGRFATAAAAAGVGRLIYLGGVAPAGPPSLHLQSRLRVGEILRAGSVPCVELRASMIVGAGSLSWLLVRDLAARLPAMVLPRWMRSRMQPVAAADVIAALVAALRVPLAHSASYDLPGPDTLSGRAILEATARALGLRAPLVVEVPLVSPWLSSHWVRLVTRAEWTVARELVLGLTHDLLADDAVFWSLIGHQPVSFAVAARRALAEPGAAAPAGLGRTVERLVAAVRRVR